jgi:hypothetical protein
LISAVGRVPARTRQQPRFLICHRVTRRTIAVLILAGASPRESGFAAITEIALFREQGIRLFGTLPPPLQTTTTHVAVPWPGLRQPATERADAVAALIRQLQGSEARSRFASAGIEPAQ